MFDLMKAFFKFFAFCLLVTTSFFCTKNSFDVSSNALINFSTDTLHFDTVFTSVGSVTQTVKIFNLNNQKLRLNKIELAGGATSSFKLNVNGLSSNSITDIDIEANDSIYIFVTANINPGQLNNPFIVRDSILINYNGNNNYIQLDAYARNARFIKNLVITHDTSFNNDLPCVLLGSLTVNPSITLTINKGTEIYCHQNAAIIINGTLKINGERKNNSRVSFSGDRLDEPYKFYPGSWQGIIFSKTSVNNEIDAAMIENATTAITIYGESNASPQLKLNACIINNNLNYGIQAVNTNVYAENCLITNCGSNNLSFNAGTYNFIFCTVAGYSDAILNRQAPVLSITDTLNSMQTAPLSANFTNSILYGNSQLFADEISLLKTGNSFTAKFDHVLYKTQSVSSTFFTNSINNSDPGFINIDQQNAIFDFHLTPQSVCKDAAKVVSTITTDLDGNPRMVGSSPDIGCYEIQ